MIAVLECLEACQTAAIDAEFPAQCGTEMLRGCLEDETQNWTDEQFQRWFEAMEAKYGSRSSVGISMTSLYRNVSKLIHIHNCRLILE